MPSLRTAGTLIQGIIAYRTCFHVRNYTLLKAAVQ